MADSQQHINSLPDEMLLQLFSWLDGATFIRSMRVCVRWRHLIKHVQEKHSTSLWKRFTLDEFGECDTVRKCIARMYWFEIYTKLYLWPRVETSAYKCHDVELEPNCDFHTVSIATDKFDKAVIVGGTAMQSVSLDNYGIYQQILGRYVDSQQNDIVRAVSTTDRGLFLKAFDNTNLFIEQVQVFLLDKTSLYYRTDGDLYQLDLTYLQGNPRLLLQTQEPLIGSLSVVKDHLYTRTETQEICLDPRGAAIMMGNPYTRDQIAGILNTFCPYHANSLNCNNKQRVDFLRKAFKDYKGYANLFKATHNNRLDLSIDDRRITSARVHNDMLIIGTVDCGVQIFRMEDLNLLREVKMPATSLGILDVQVNERFRSCDLIVMTKHYVNVIVFSHKDLIVSKCFN